MDGFFGLMARLGVLGYRGMRRTQNGKMRTYAAGLAIGAVVVIAMVVWL